MTLIIVLLIFVLLLGGLGLFAGSLQWLLIVALIVLVVAVLLGYRTRL